MGQTSQRKSQAILRQKKRRRLQYRARPQLLLLPQPRKHQHLRRRSEPSGTSLRTRSQSRSLQRASQRRMQKSRLRKEILMSASQLLPQTALMTTHSLPSSPKSTLPRARSESHPTRSKLSSKNPSRVSNGHLSKAPSPSHPPRPKSQQRRFPRQ